ncbi:putative endonuclease [Jatrophihabitans sp. GAS493]|uniref:YraN family protein n=1 Tax=Jatrophihabitans sp. GAS493 TaxID=1907575 RepID=UPI000BB80878|nr:YraN family protein [Jatrophihabitans sp. GAS493]SOD74197.1 putative endonuclease [Jatrophihabitans sp. GAS493]
MRAKDAIGKYGEDVAARHLQESGLEILERNWRCRAGELDIVALDGETLVFCEVKTRSGVGFGTPLEAITPVKAARIRRLAVQWLNQKRQSEQLRYHRGLRFDVVAVLRARSGAAEVTHVTAAF